jgi:rSAM/selenodomain-associated transferase 2/rSAM/selenodomain-associated transferase 1
VSGPFVSVVIPVWCDVERAERAAVSASGEGIEIIAAAAWEDADAVARVRSSTGRVRWLFARRGRGNQMNAGAAVATGEWLLFLHADSQLPGGWLEDIRAAAASGLAAGCFRLGIAATGWRPRAWESIVRWRVALLTLPYGDQGLFVRRDLFDALGGYRDMPLMEDVDFVRRVRRRTGMWKSSRRVLTSARRWERDGWFRRSATNLTLLFRYRFGADIRRLARVYLGHSDTVVAVLARAPSVPGKTRLGTSAPELRRALLLDTWDAVLEGSWDAALIFTPAESAAECASLTRGSRRPPLLMPQAGDDLGARISAAFRELFAAGYLRVILIGSDLPTLPAERLRAADRALRTGADVVLGPAEDGGYYLVGLSGSRDAMFSGVSWGAPDVFLQTTAWAETAGLRVKTVGSWYDVDTPRDLQRTATAAGSRGGRTRRLIGG